MNKDKNYYRTKYKGLRMKLSQKEVSSLSEKIFSFIPLSLWHNTTFHVFMSSSKKKEVETKEILSYLYSLNKTVVTSKILANKNLIHFRINKTTHFIENSYKILEPDSSEEIGSTELDVIFIPLLCFDKQGNRVGYGGGYYDRFLSNTKDSCIKIGLSFFEPVNLIEGTSKLDVPLDACVTPERIYDFRQEIIPSNYRRNIDRNDF